MYAVHPIPLSEVKAVRKHTPSFGWQYIVLVLVNGLTLPPLYFGTGGVRALFATLKQVQLAARRACLQSAFMSLESSQKFSCAASVQSYVCGTELHMRSNAGQKEDYIDGSLMPSATCLAAANQKSFDKGLALAASSLHLLSTRYHCQSKTFIWHVFLPRPLTQIKARLLSYCGQCSCQSCPGENREQGGPCPSTHVYPLFAASAAAVTIPTLVGTQDCGHAASGPLTSLCISADINHSRPVDSAGSSCLISCIQISECVIGNLVLRINPLMCCDAAHLLGEGVR